MLITSRGTLIRLPVAGISKLGRATQGVHLVRLGDEDRVVAVAHMAQDEEEVEAEGATAPSPRLVSKDEQEAEAETETDSDESEDADS